MYKPFINQDKNIDNEVCYVGIKFPKLLTLFYWLDFFAISPTPMLHGSIYQLRVLGLF